LDDYKDVLFSNFLSDKATSVTLRVLKQKQAYYEATLTQPKQTSYISVLVAYLPAEMLM